MHNTWAFFILKYAAMKTTNILKLKLQINVTLEMSTKKS